MTKTEPDKSPKTQMRTKTRVSMVAKLENWSTEKLVCFKTMKKVSTD